MSTEIKNPVKINNVYADWDCIVVQLHDEGTNTGKANIKMMRQDLEAIVQNHGGSRGDVIEMMLQALEEEVTTKENGSADA